MSRTTIGITAAAALAAGLLGWQVSRGRPPDPVDKELMGRIRTIGFEAKGISTAADTSRFEGRLSGASPTIDTTTFRSGTASLRCDSGGGAGNFSEDTITFADSDPTITSRTLFLRSYIFVDTLPTLTQRIIRIGTILSLNLFNDGTMGIFALSQQGSSFGSISINTWYRIEIEYVFLSGSNDTVKVRVDGVELFSGTFAVESVLSNNFTLGWGGNPGANKSIYYDDVALNDNQGSDQNSYPGEGKIVYAIPISDNQRGSWTGGSGGTSNLFEAVNNQPPVGTATETDTTQIENSDTSPDNATDEYRVNLTTYTNLGIGSADTITLAQAVIDHGEDVGTGTKTGSLAFQSNPTQSGVDTFTFGDDIGALGTWPTSWRAKWGTAQYSPSVTKGNSPVLALRKTDTGSRVASCDQIGAYVEYVPAAAASNPGHLPMIGVGR